jgi:uncharacterized membrane protein
MTGKQVIILIGALIVSALILWHDFPIEFPGIIGRVLMLFVKLIVVVALTIFAIHTREGRRSRHEGVAETSPDL